MFRWGWLVALSALALDQVTKAIIVARIPESVIGSLSIIEVTSFFNIWHVRNSGIAFSIGNFSEGGRFFLGALAIVVTCILFWVGHRSKVNQLILAYALIAGGALGNAFDRLNPQRQTVVDFLDFHIGRMHWPSFNVADTAIVLGVALILFDMLFFSDKREKLKKANG